MRKYSLLFLALTTTCLAISCTAAKPEAAPPPPAPASTPVATIQDIMLGIIDPSADFIWESIGTEVSAAGILEKQPRTDEEWKEERRHALILVEAANLLLVPGRKVAADSHKSENPGIELEAHEMEELMKKDPGTFAKRAKEFQDIAILQLKAVEARDLDGLLRYGGEIDTTCENCHKVYWYPNDPVFVAEREAEAKAAAEKK